MGTRRYKGIYSEMEITRKLLWWKGVIVIMVVWVGFSLIQDIFGQWIEVSERKYQQYEEKVDFGHVIILIDD